jgi:hypothetical protein
MPKPEAVAVRAHTFLQRQRFNFSKSHDVSRYVQMLKLSLLWSGEG